MATPVRPAADLQLPSSQISPSTLALYLRCRENGYDLPDPEYRRWFAQARITLITYNIHNNYYT